MNLRITISIAVDARKHLTSFVLEPWSSTNDAGEAQTQSIARPDLVAALDGATCDLKDVNDSERSAIMLIDILRAVYAYIWCVLLPLSCVLTGTARKAT